MAPLLPPEPFGQGTIRWEFCRVHERETYAARARRHCDAEAARETCVRYLRLESFDIVARALSCARYGTSARPSRRTSRVGCLDHAKWPPSSTFLRRTGGGPD